MAATRLTTGVIEDNSFEAGAGGEAWILLGKPWHAALRGGVLGGGPDQAFIGHGWVHFRNAPETTEIAYVRQTAVFPVENQGNLRFYLHGFPSTTSIDFRVYVDKSLLVALNETQLAAYTDYLPLTSISAVSSMACPMSWSSSFRWRLERPPPCMWTMCASNSSVAVRVKAERQDVCDEDPNDTDMDGLSDQCEICYGTTAVLADSDDDGMTDVFEIAQGLQPQNPLDGNADLDGDGLTNVEEFHRKSRPYDVNDPYTVVYVARRR